LRGIYRVGTPGRSGVDNRLFVDAILWMADTPDFEYVMIDSTISKVYADATGAKGGLKIPPSVAR